VLRRENVFWANDDPVYLVTTYVPWTIAAGTGLLEAEVPHPYGIHGVLEEQGYPMARLDDYATARMPTHVSVRADDTPYELTRFVMRGDMSSLSYNVPVE
jgi:GntR family transcriptional regulator